MQPWAIHAIDLRLTKTLDAIIEKVSVATGGGGPSEVQADLRVRSAYLRSSTSWGL